MKKLPFIFALLFFACKSKTTDADVKPKIAPKVRQYISSMRLGHIDTLDIYKIATLHSGYAYKLGAGELAIKMEKNNERVEKIVKDMKFNRRLQNISYASYMEMEIREQAKEGQAIIAESRQFDSLRKIFQAKADTASKKDFLGYVVRFNLKYSDSATLVQHRIDSGSVIVTPDFKIKEKKQFLTE